MILASDTSVHVLEWLGLATASITFCSLLWVKLLSPLARAALVIPDAVELIKEYPPRHLREMEELAESTAKSLTLLTIQVAELTEQVKLGFQENDDFHHNLLDRVMVLPCVEGVDPETGAITRVKKPAYEYPYEDYRSYRRQAETRRDYEHRRDEEEEEGEEGQNESRKQSPMG